jgi:hypothetical protein
MRKFSIWLERAALFPLAIGLLVAYLTTMAPGLTWANGGSDGGDLIAAAATGGIAHPTGYPTYLLIARLFQLLPIGALAFRTNLMSALFTISAALLVYVVVQRAIETATWVARVGGSMVAGLAFGLAPIVWSQAIITEVYGLGVFFVALLLYLLTPATPWSWRRAAVAGLVQGLAVGNQMIAALMIPATLVCITLTSQRQPETPASGDSSSRWRVNWRTLAASCLGLIVGLMIYLILPLRAASHPPVNWGDPVAPDGFAWLVSGKLYQNQLIHVDLAGSLAHLQSWASLTLQAFGILGLIAGLTGLIFFFHPSRLQFLTIWIAVAYTAFAIQYEVVDSFVYLLPTFLAFAVWIGLGVGEAVQVLARLRPGLDWILGLACVGYLVFLGAVRFPQVDVSHDLRAERFGQYVMTNAPQNAILFARTDRVVFSLWYFHYALRTRPDLAVTANDLLPFDWYRENLSHVYPDLVLPAPSNDPWLLSVRQANPTRPACYLYDPTTPLNCE